MSTRGRRDKRARKVRSMPAKGPGSCDKHQGKGSRNTEPTSVLRQVDESRTREEKREGAKHAGERPIIGSCDKHQGKGSRNAEPTSVLRRVDESRRRRRDARGTLAKSPGRCDEHKRESAMTRRTREEMRKARRRKVSQVRDHKRESAMSTKRRRDKRAKRCPKHAGEASATPAGRPKVSKDGEKQETARALGHGGELPTPNG